MAKVVLELASLAVAVTLVEVALALAALAAVTFVAMASRTNKSGFSSSGNYSGCVTPNWTKW